jgi:hypothetical protein
MQGASRRQGPSLAKRRNAADTLSRGNPEGRADSGVSLCREPLAVNDTAARLASRAASRIGLVADVKLGLTRPVIDNADLHLLSPAAKGELSEDQLERKHALFAILVSLFERAYVLVYEDDMSRQQQRLWQSWEDYMTEWCQRADFRAALPALLQGEDMGFVSTIRRIAGAASDQAEKNPETSAAQPPKAW